MIILLSPSKGQDFAPNELAEYSQPAMLSQTRILVKELKSYKPQQIAQLMSVSENLAELNHQRYQSFKTPLKLGVAKQAALAFKGDVYLGLDAETLSDSDWQYAQQHLRILSGLYGYLKPLDLILPYRLEMKTKLSNPRGENLYQFWEDRITKLANKELENEDFVVNLASNEYAKAIKPKNLKAPVLNIAFKDSKEGKTRTIGFYAKQARGMMARALIENKVTSQDEIKAMNIDGYQYREDLSKSLNWVFERQQPPLKK